MHFLSAVDEGCVVSPSGTHREVFITCSRALLSIGGQLTLSQGWCNHLMAAAQLSGPGTRGCHPVSNSQQLQPLLVLPRPSVQILAGHGRTANLAALHVCSVSTSQGAAGTSSSSKASKRGPGSAAGGGSSSSSRRKHQWDELEDGWEVTVPSQQPMPASTTQPAAASQPQQGKGRKPAGGSGPGSSSVVSIEGADDGWGVDPVAQPGSKPAGKKGTSSTAAKAPGKGQPPTAAAGADSGKSKAGPGKQGGRSPFMSLRSEQGIMSLALLQARLRREDGTPMSPEELQDLRRQLGEMRAAAGKGPAGGLGAAAAAAIGGSSVAAAAVAAAKAGVKRKKVVYVDDDENIIGEEDEDEEVTDGATPSFSLTIGEEGAEFSEFDRRTGAVTRRTLTPLADIEDEEQEEEQQQQQQRKGLPKPRASSSLVAPTQRATKGGRATSKGTLLGMDDDDEEEEEEEEEQQASRASLQKQGRRKPLQEEEEEEEDGNEDLVLSARDVERLLGDQGASGSGQGGEGEGEPDDWGLEEIKTRESQSLMEQLGVVKSRKGKKGKKGRGYEDDDEEAPEGTLAAEGAAEIWGGSGLQGMPAGADLAEQEALLARMFKPHKVKQLLAHQRAAYEASQALKTGASTRGKFGAEAKLHRQLRIISGAAANKKLLSSQGAQTRPMMEKVRAAIFNMILSQAGSGSTLPATARWLDLFAGTGSVGLEALSRGAGMTHFVEYDPWVCRNILGKNITTCGFNKKSVVHTGKVEDFLRKAKALPRFAGGAFDFISMCPPYLLVSYPELYDLLEGSPLIHDRTILFVEYPKQLSKEVPDTVGPLECVRDRKYGRTWIKVYAGVGLLRGSEDDEGDEFYDDDEDEE